MKKLPRRVTAYWQDTDTNNRNFFHATFLTYPGVLSKSACKESVS